MIKNFRLRDGRKVRSTKVLPHLAAHAHKHEDCALPHYHKDAEGFLVQCYHVCQKQALGIWQVLRSPAFWIGITVTYPFEHALYEKVWPFLIVSQWLHGGH